MHTHVHTGAALESLRNIGHGPSEMAALRDDLQVISHGLHTFRHGPTKDRPIGMDHKASAIWHRP